MIDIKKIKVGDRLKIKAGLSRLPEGHKITVEKVEGCLIWFTDSVLGYGYLPDTDFDPCDTGPETKPADSFKLGKYKLSSGVIVTAIGCHKDFVWCECDDGTYMTVPASVLTPLAKFDHLRGLAVDTKVVVWDNPDGTKTKGHFSHISECGEFVYCFVSGRTSFTSDKKIDGGFVVNGWDNCEVWEEKNGN